MSGLANLLAALSAVTEAAGGYVQKTGKNAHQGYTYANEQGLLEKLHPAMAAHGLLLIPSVEGEERYDAHGNVYLTVAYTLAHKSGEVWPHPIRVVGCGADKNKNGCGDKAVYKAMTGANKYALFKLFQIATGDDPENDEPQEAPSRRSAQTPPPAGGLSENQIKRLYAIAKANGIKGKEDLRVFLAGLEGFPAAEHQLTKTQYDELCDKRLPALGGAR